MTQSHDIITPPATYTRVTHIMFMTALIANDVHQHAPLLQELAVMGSAQEQEIGRMCTLVCEKSIQTRMRR